MSANLFYTSSNNSFSSTTASSVAITDTSITLTSVTGLATTGGVLTLDRVDGNGNSTPTLREYISYTAISGNAVTGCTRGLAGSSAQAHVSGAIVEECFTVTHWNSHLDAIKNVLTSAGALDITKVTDLSSSQTLTNKTLTSPIISSISNTGTITLPTSSDTLVGKATTDTLTNKTLTKPTINGSIQGLTADSDGATITFNMTSSNVHSVTLGGARTLAVSNVSTGQAFIIILLQDGSGSRTVTWFSGIKWAGAAAPTLTTTASRYDIFSFLYDGTNYYGSIVGQNFG